MKPGQSARLSNHPLGMESDILESHRIISLEEGSESIAEQLSCMEPWRTLGYTAARLQNYLTSPDPCLRCMAIVAGEADELRLVGVACVRFPWLFGAYLELFAIFPDYQGMGLGTKVLTWLERRVAEKTRNLWIIVSSFNESARAFYRKRGFFEVTKLEDLITVGFDEILLRKNLMHNA